MRRSDYDPSKDRQELGRLVEEFCSLTRDLAGYEPILNGNIQKLSRRCGKANCRCSQGRLHRSTVFIDRSSGVRKVRTLTIGEHELVRKPTLAFQALRRKRARLSKLFQEALAFCDRLSAFRASQGRLKLQEFLKLKGSP